MDEHVSWGMVERWVGEYYRGRVCSSARIGKLVIEVDSKMIGIKNPETGLMQMVDPKDFEIGSLREGAKVLVCGAGEGDYFVYVLNPESEKVVLLELVLEKEAFGVYSQDYPLGFELSGRFYASALGKSLLVVDLEKERYVFFSGRGKKIGAEVELGGAKAECTVVDGEVAAICTPSILFVIRGGKRVGIDIAGALGREARNPEFGVGESEKHRWLAVRDGEDAVIVSLTDKDMGYAVLHGNELKGKEII